MTDRATGDELPDSGMMTGSDEGAPGEHLPPEPLDDADRAVLGTLRDGDGGSGPEAVEESAAAARAADEDAPLPALGDTGEQSALDDPETPSFHEP